LHRHTELDEEDMANCHSYWLDSGRTIAADVVEDNEPGADAIPSRLEPIVPLRPFCGQDVYGDELWYKIGFWPGEKWTEVTYEEDTAFSQAASWAFKVHQNAYMRGLQSYYRETVPDPRLPPLV
jgi:hypothetical protein